MDGFLQDCRYGLRTLIKTPGFTAIAVLTLALGIGANAAIFSFIDGVLLKPLPYPDPNNILFVWEKPPGRDRNGVSALNYLDWHNQNKVFQYSAAISGKAVSMSGMGEPQRLNAETASASYFDILGISPARGRTFAPDEDQPGKDQVAVLSSRIWKSQFGSDPNIIGKSIILDARPYSVIGVMPADSEFDRGWQDIWLPLAFGPDDLTRNFHWMRVIARLKPGVTMAQAQADMDGIASRIEEQYPDSNKGWGVHLDRYPDMVVDRDLKHSLYLLLAAVAFVLLIACVNIANLLLARGATRAKELAIRAALGAGRSRMIRQLLTESVFMSLIGVAIAIPLGYGLMRGIQAALPPFSLPPQANVTFDYRVLAFLLMIAVVTAILFGLGPALHITRGGANDALREGARGSTTGGAHHRFSSILVVAEVALAMVLLAGAGLVIRSFYRLLNVDMGIRTDHVLTMGLPMSMSQNTDGQRLTNYLRGLLESIQAVPGVAEAAVTTTLPMEGWGNGMPFQISSHPFTDVSHRDACFYKVISPSYFRALGMRLDRGRYLADSDTKGSQPAIVINEEMAKEYFYKDEDPLGKTILIQEIVTGKHVDGPEIPWQVVGIVSNEKVGNLEETDPGVYVPFTQNPIVGNDLLVRTHGDPAAMGKAIQEAVWRVNKDQALPDVKTLDQIKSETSSSEMLRTVLLGVFAAVALLLSAIGIYGVISYSVAQRTKEIGIRAALGASALDLLRLVVGHGMLLAGIGLVLGSAGALALTRLMSSLLYNTSPHDWPTLVAVELILASVALAACLVPATRAMRVDPMVALHYE
ncbi:MAG TPA: ABC transporter permease [Blastocatellia bacterium]